ncbi:MAG: tetratricopeptide repeat protein [Bryobacteraceae bacterium]
MKLTRQYLAGLALCLFAFTGSSLAQTSSLEGVVKGEDGQPLKDAVINIDRKDIKGHYQVKTKKKGDYFHAGLPLGTYKVTLVVDGKERDSVDNVRTRLGDPLPVNFDLQGQKARGEAQAKAVEAGQLPPEQARDMTPEQKAALEKQIKERAGAMKKNKELNDSFNQGMEALKGKQFDVAVTAFTKAAELDPNQNVIWGNLAETYSELSKTKTGAEKDAALNKAVEAYKKAIELQPTDASYHNNYALTLARLNKFPEMQAELTKAVELDAPNAGRYYYNMGAVLVNSNQLGPACDAFDKAIVADANYADAHYQKAMCMTSKATVDKDGKTIFPEGTDKEFQAYLQLKPDGPFAESSKGMLQAMGAKIDTEYRNPNAPAPTKKAAPAKKK